MVPEDGPMVSNEAKALAGLLLKNHLMSDNREEGGDSSLPRHAPYIQEGLLQALTHGSSTLVRATAGTVVTKWLARFGLASWPTVLSRLVELVDQTGDTQALATLLKIAEDAGDRLCREQPGQADALVCQLLTWAAQLPLSMATVALRTLNELVPHSGARVGRELDSLLRVLSTRATEALGATSGPEGALTPTGEASVCAICGLLVTLLQHHATAMRASLTGLLDFTVALLGRAEDTVALQACEFWNLLVATLDEDVFGLLRPVLPQLVSLLLHKMAYAATDPVLLHFGTDSTATSVAAPDADTDIRPRHFRSHMQQAQAGLKGSAEAGHSDADSDEDSDDDSDEDEEAFEWNVRKCAAATLDALSSWFDAAVIEHVLFPQLTRLLQQQEDWRLREVGILALGAVAVHCQAALAPFLPTLLPLLAAGVADAYPLVRSISCWALSRFSGWRGLEATQLDVVVAALLRALQDRNKRVQGAAFSALACYLEDAPLLMLSHVPSLVQAVQRVFPEVQKKNRVALLDLVATLGLALQDLPQAVPLARSLEVFHLLGPPLLDLLLDTSEFSGDIFPVMEAVAAWCLFFKPLFLAPPPSSAAASLLQAFVARLFSAAWTFIVEALILEDASDEALELEELALAGLELWSVVLQLMPSDVFCQLMERESSPSWHQLFLRALQRQSADIRQTMLAVIADLCLLHESFVKGYAGIFLSHLLPAIQDSLLPSNVDGAGLGAGPGPSSAASSTSTFKVVFSSNPLSVVHNALFSLGELCRVLSSLDHPSTSSLAALWPIILQKCLYLVLSAGKLHLSPSLSCVLAVTFARLLAFDDPLENLGLLTAATPLSQCLSSWISLATLHIKSPVLLDDSYLAWCRVFSALFSSSNFSHASIPAATPSSHLPATTDSSTLSSSSSSSNNLDLVTCLLFFIFSYNPSNDSSKQLLDTFSGLLATVKANLDPQMFSSLMNSSFQKVPQSLRQFYHI